MRGKDDGELASKMMQRALELVPRGDPLRATWLRLGGRLELELRPRRSELFQRLGADGLLYDMTAVCDGERVLIGVYDGRGYGGYRGDIRRAAEQLGWKVVFLPRPDEQLPG